MGGLRQRNSQKTQQKVADVFISYFYTLLSNKLEQELLFFDSNSWWCDFSNRRTNPTNDECNAFTSHSFFRSFLAYFDFNYNN